MASDNTSTSVSIVNDHGTSVEVAVLAMTSFSMVLIPIFLVTRLCCKYVLPEAWRLSLILQDLAYLLLGTGLVFFLAYMGTGRTGLCSAAGFFLLVGLLDTCCMLALTAISLLFLQNPGKLGQLSTFRKTWMLFFLVPEKVVVFLLALMPVMPISYFDTDSPYPVACFPVRQEGSKGGAFGAILFFILWVLHVLGIALSLLCAFRLWKSNKSRIHASSPNLWQTEKIGQGRTLQKILLLEQLFLLVLTFILTIVLYTNSQSTLTPQWVVMTTVALATILHACMCGVQLVLWSSVCCCQTSQQTKEPYQRLKKLELIKVEGPGKLRLMASWSAGRGAVRRGLVKVYGLNQLKGWAQEIVVLGMLRKSQNASLLQCLWTANTNPYFETMTMLSGQIVTAEARLICLELTSSGNLQNFLSSLDVPLPEPCTRTILHDLAEGLAALHAQNILHSNLTSTAVYLKGSVQRLVLRAAVGDFEEAQIYGSLQNGTISSCVSKKHFFLPDVRAFALVALEILGFICKRRQEEKQPHRLVSSPASHPSPWGGQGREEQASRVVRKAPHSSNTHFCAPGVAEVFQDSVPRAGDRVVVVGTAVEEGAEDVKMRKGRRLREEEERSGVPGQGTDAVENEYMEVGEYGEGDSGMGGYYPDRPDQEHPADSRLPAITHVREAYQYEFPNQSVFRAQGVHDDDYEEIDDIEEEIHRELRYNALYRRREAPQTGGYIVTRTTSGRELFIPAQQHNTSFGNSDSGYVGTSSNSSRYPYPPTHPSGEAEDPPEVSWPKAAHRTVSANTISSFGDDVLEVLPGMADEEDKGAGDRTLRQMLRAREDAKVEQILEEYQQRVRTGGLDKQHQDWPKLKFSRTMGHKGGEVGEGGRGSRPSTPRAAQTALQSPRPKTAAPDPETGRTMRADKARPLSASVTSAGKWQLRSSFKKNKARNQLARALSRGHSFVHSHRALQVQRATGGQLIQQKYAEHNAAARQAEKARVPQGQEDEDGYLQPQVAAAARDLTDHQHITTQPASSESHHQQQTPQQQDQGGHQGHQRAPSDMNVGRFSSFSSSDSLMSYGQPQHRRDTSLTSGELTSLSSQADTARACCEHLSQLPETEGVEGEGGQISVVALPGMKLVDSGFDEDSASVVSDFSCHNSPPVSAEACTCSCQSDTVTGSETCSCECSQCQYSHCGSARHSGCSESQSSCGTWSNSNSFSSYDVKMHRRKLPSTPKAPPPEEHVLGPDEQYPVHPPPSVHPPQPKLPGSPLRLSPPARNTHRHHHHHHHNHHHSHSGSSAESSAASRRYRELTKKGVPLRVTAVDDDMSRTDRHRPVSALHVSTAEVIQEEEDGPDNALYQDLESQGFFESTDSASSKSSPTRAKKRVLPKRLEMVQGGHSGGGVLNPFADLAPIPSLEDIIREIPDETGGSCSGDETKAFLNRPESELSLKALKAPAPRPPADCLPYGKGHISELHREPKVVHDAELVIDRIFSRAHPAYSKSSEGFVDPALGLDEAAIRELAMLPPLPDSQDHVAHDTSSQGDLNTPLLKGTDSKHVRYVHSLSDKLDLLSTSQLLPADPRNFDILKQRLLHTGSFGTIGVQLLEIIGSCWVKEAPPTTADIVDQLTDHVTETEL